MQKNITAQELYNAFYVEACRRAQLKGNPPPSEIEVFKLLVEKTRQAILDEEAPPEFLEELAEVKPQVALKAEQARREEEEYKAFKEGRMTLKDLESIIGKRKNESTGDVELKNAIQTNKIELNKIIPILKK